MDAAVPKLLYSPVRLLRTVLVPITRRRNDVRQSSTFVSDNFVGFVMTLVAECLCLVK